VKIYKATPATIPRMVAYGQQFWHQTAYYKDYGIEYDVETVTAMAHHCMEKGVARYAIEGHQIVGLMLCLVAPVLMNANHSHAVEWVFYVDEAYRRTGLGKTLIELAEKELKELGVVMLSMVCLTNVTPDAAIGLYEKLGYKHSETSMTKDLR